jgi:hypothetical protein
MANLNDTQGHRFGLDAPLHCGVVLLAPRQYCPVVRRRSFNTLRGNRRRGALALAGGLLALAAAGSACGKGTDTSLPGPDSTTPPLSKVDFNAQANEICRATTAAIAKLTDDIGSGNLGTPGGDREQLNKAVQPVVAQALAKLRNLTPPPQDAAMVRGGFDAMAADANRLGTDPQAPLDPIGLERPELFAYGLSGCFTNASQDQ